MDYPYYLVLMDVDRIQEYIFATNRLKEIRGASLLLDRLNNQECRELLPQFQGEEVFIGGGGVLAKFPSEDKANFYITAIQMRYREQAQGATITGIKVPVPNVESEQDALRQARVDLRLAKGERSTKHSTLTSPYFRICTSCNTYPVIGRSDGDELCGTCIKKREAVQWRTNKLQTTAPRFPSYSGYAKFAQRAATLYADPGWLELESTPDKLDQLEGKETSYIGFIHADVNGLGMMLEQQHNLQGVQILGHKVEEVIENALVDAIYHIELRPKTSQWPFLIIIMGGDDLTLIVPAKKAVALANHLCLAFERHIQQALGDLQGIQATTPPLAMSAGVVIAKPKHPAYALASLAGDLTANAKRRSYELHQKWGKVPTIDFQVVYTPTARPIEKVRTNEYWRQEGAQEYWYTARPLPCRPLADEISAQTLLDTVRAFRHKQFPRNKLHAWYELMFRGDDERILGLKTIQSRVTGPAYDALIDAICKLNLSRERLFAQPGGIGQPYVSPLLDLVELYDFVD